MPREQKRIKEKFTKLVKTGFFYIFGSSVLNKIVTFISTILLVRIITKSEYGIFTYAWNIFSFIYLFSGFGIELGSMQLLSENENDSNKFNGIYQFGVKAGLTFNILLAAIIICISLLVSLPIEGSNNILLILCLLPEVMFLYCMQTSFLRSSKKNKDFAFLSIVNTVILMCTSLIGAYFFKGRGLSYAYYITNIVTVLIGYFYIRVPFIDYKSNALLKEDKYDLLKISGISMLNNGLSQVLYLSDVFIVGMVLANDLSVASYRVAATIPTALSFIPNAIIIYVYPYFASHRKDHKWCLVKFREIVVTIGLLNFCISTILFLFAPQIITLIFGKQYIDAVTPFRILSIGYFFQGTFRIIAGNLLITQRKLVFNTIEATISGLVNIIADYVLISHFGLNGAAYATLIVMILSSVMCTAYFHYVIKN